jgi:hypothetical protein
LFFGKYRVTKTTASGRSVVRVARDKQEAVTPRAAGTWMPSRRMTSSDTGASSAPNVAPRLHFRACPRSLRFIPALNIPEDDLGEAVDIVLELVAD